MAASIWFVYDQALLELGEALIDFTSGTYKVALFLSTSNIPVTSMSPATYAAATNEVANGNGYAAGGVTVAVTWSNSAGTQTLASAAATWTPTGAGILARYALLYNSTTGKAIAYTLLNTTPSDVSVTQITFAAAGAFTLARAA